MIIELRNGTAVVTDKVKMVRQIRKYHCGQTCTFDIVFNDGETYAAHYDGRNAEANSKVDRESLFKALNS